MTFWHWIVANHVVILTGLVLVLKWVYNAWTPGITFLLFLRGFIGEIVQEAPISLSPSQQKILMDAGQPAEK
jgi:hypothetical protein